MVISPEGSQPNAAPAQRAHPALSMSGGGGTPSKRAPYVRDFDPRSIAKPGQGLGDLHPELAKQALHCVAYPKLDVSRVTTKSSLAFIWHCQCGAEFPRRVQYVTRLGAVVCDGCRPAGKSRLEFEVAELLRSMLGTEVQTHVGVRRKDEVDLHLPAFGLAVELDPRLSHMHKLESDLARLALHEETWGRAIRVREEGIPVIDGCPVVPARSGPYGWARVIAEYATSNYSQPGAWTSLDDLDQQAAVSRGGQAWLALLRTPPSPSLADRAELVAEFVRDLEIPGRTPPWISIGAGARCWWRCLTCQHEYPQTVDKRTGSMGVGCPQCKWVKVTAARRKPAAGASAADKTPDLVAEFVGNLTTPGADPTSMRPRSRDVCVWRCSTSGCAVEWESTLHSRTISLHVGCRACNFKAAWVRRREDQGAPHIQARQRSLAALAAYVAEHGDARVPLGYVTAEGHGLGEWVQTQRRKRATLSAQQRAELAALPGWVWTAKADRWEDQFAALQAFVAREGHAQVPHKHCEAGLPLGTFIAKQRSRYRSKDLQREHRVRLESVPGWSWVGLGRGQHTLQQRQPATRSCSMPERDRCTSE